MRLSVFAAVAAAAVSTGVIVACSSDPANSLADGGAAGTDGGTSVDGSTDPDGSSADGATRDGDAEDGGGKVDGAAAPSVQLIGRFEAEGANFNFAFPGSKLIARFNGTDATVRLTQTDGFSVGHSWFNVIIDGVPQAKLEINGASVDYPVATNLAPGAHVVELEKRTEAIFGVVRYEGFTFPNGGVLLGPPARKTRRIEFLSESTVDGFGVEGNLNPAAPNYCGLATMENNFGAPANLSNARKSMATLAATALGAETFLIAYSGKGVTTNNNPEDPLTFPLLYERALPDVAGSAYGFGLQVDAVVISLGGVDNNGLSVAPAGFAAAYGSLVDKARAHYPGAWIFLTVWAQIKDYGGGPTTRTAMKNALQTVIDARAGDTKLSLFQFPESNGGEFGGADESACQFHANEGLHVSAAALLSAEIKTKLGW